VNRHSKKRSTHWFTHDGHHQIDRTGVSGATVESFAISDLEHAERAAITRVPRLRRDCNFPAILKSILHRAAVARRRFVFEPIHHLGEVDFAEQAKVRFNPFSLQPESGRRPLDCFESWPQRLWSVGPTNYTAGGRHF
jgi:hypothetical protein